MWVCECGKTKVRSGDVSQAFMQKKRQGRRHKAACAWQGSQAYVVVTVTHKRLTAVEGVAAGCDELVGEGEG